MHFDRAGDSVQGHTHNFDHVTLILTGAVRIKYRRQTADGKIELQGEREFRAPNKLYDASAEPAFALIRANVMHEIIALEDNTHCWCVFAHRDPTTGEVVEQWNGWRGANT